MGRYVFEHPLSVYEALDRHKSRGHQRLYSIDELIDLLEVYGFDVIDVWCIDNKAPLLSKSKYKNQITGEHINQLFKSFWSENRSLKGRIKCGSSLLMLTIKTRAGPDALAADHCRKRNIFSYLVAFN